MYLKLTPPFSELLSFNCRQLLVSCLAGTVIVGSGSVLVFNSSISTKLNEAIRPAFAQLALTPFGKGINALGNTISEWGASVVGKKDDFQQWFQSFFNIDGIKSGTLELYEKLVAWAKIVYEWFANKFLKFIGNIPEMVKNWKELRLSLFKWGTFLGGGGGSALWAMFGNSANWSKLGDLMGHPKFEEMINDFNTLVQENPRRFWRFRCRRNWRDFRTVFRWSW
ncbi:hypothetical protein A6V39_00925 [Candidatus Mycoplasma haematobovis]|uniref:Uncharacterized protein n=1 Tax=Candidatus Mycoplasma haematobovis TaxID=432608 RepID=A0A1A9QF73_9MOLU|nr:hypothetical protein [Candidatus Mycoplasma haematobovis]OAL10615.1 hypothetical protein A6V39_00925 [Candidatus Mycoplasma haematobovis]